MVEESTCGVSQMTARTETMSDGMEIQWQPDINQYFSSICSSRKMMACNLKFTESAVPLPLSMSTRAGGSGQL